VEQWARAEQNWCQNIAGQFKVEQIDIERLVGEKMDLGKKGYLFVEDIVRFLNLETGNFLRNRDLVMAYRRLTKKDKLYWK
jgi:hypothetical protein